MITATTPGLVSANLVLIQIIAGFTFFKYYAHGNVFMIFTVAWTLMQWFWLYLLLWNDDLYLYDLRIIRYFVLLGAITFVGFYLFALAVELDLVLLEGKIYKQDSAAELILALIIGELLLYYAPSMLVNSLICLKEMTLNQFAWRKKDDFKEGEFFNMVNMDLFYYFGFDENINNHLVWLVAWTH